MNATSFVLAAAAMTTVLAPAQASEAQLNLQGYAATKAPWNSGDVKAIAAAYTSDGTFQSPATGTALNREGLTQYLGALFTAMPDLKVTSLKTTISIDGKTVTDEWMIEGSWTKPFPGGQLAGMPATGKTIKLPGVSVVQMEGGRIKQYTQYFDNMSFLVQMGVVPAPRR